MAPSAAIRVVIVDDHGIVREGLRTLLGDETKIEIVGEAANAEDAITITKEMTPDVVLMDVALPGQNGIEAAAAIKKMGSPSKVVLLTSALGDELQLQEAINAGVMGYLLKDVSKSELLWSIESAHRGAPVFHPAVQKQLLRALAASVFPMRN